jgi:serine/threonine-protein kinase
MSIIRIQGEDEKRRNIHYEVDTSLPSLGEGGMGQVLRGVRVNERNGLRQDVAIKFLFEDLPAHAVERAKREASIQISNENLVEMFGFIEVVEPRAGREPLRRYHVVSELLQGVMLFDLLNGKTTDKYGNEVPYAQELYSKYQNDKFGFAVLIVKNILSGLMALHDKGYIHRDLDPSNIMITVDRKIKIIDFGIAKQLDSLNTQDQQLTSTGQFIGKAAYAAPELVLGDVHHQDKTTDIYAVGIMLYQFIVGSMPFEGTMAELIKHQLNDKIPLKAVPYKAIRRIISKATAKSQRDRYQSAAEMRVDLEHLTKADATPSKTVIDGVTTQMAEIGGNKKRIGIIGAVAAAIVAVAVIVPIALSGNNDDSQSAEQPVAVKVVNTQPKPKPEVSIAELSDKAMAMLTANADSAQLQEGVEQLQKIAAKYSGEKDAAKSIAMLAALTQPNDVTISTERIKSLRELTADLMSRDATKGHELALQATEADPTCYQALFELATDYAAADKRIKKGQDSDFKKALELYRKGQQYARQSNDSEYVKLFQQRIDQVVPLIEDTNESDE